MLVWSRSGRILVWTFGALLLAVLFLAPLAVILVASLSRQWNGALPTGFTLEHYAEVFTGASGDAVWASVVTGLVASLFALVTGAWAAVRYTSLPWGTEMEVQVTGIAAGTRCQLLVTGPRGQDLAAGGWTIAAGHLAAWYPASVPFQDISVRGFAVKAGGKILVTVKAG